MKFYLLILLFILFVFLGVFVWGCFYVRHIFYKDMVFACKYLRNNIAFNKNGLSELFSNISKKISPFSRYILNRKSSNLLIFKKEDLSNAKEFINSLGKGDVEYELNNLAYYENNFEEMRMSSKEELDKNGAMYFKLIIGIGLAVCIILL